MNRTIFSNINHDSTLILNLVLSLYHIFPHRPQSFCKTNNTRVRTSALHNHPCFHDPCTTFHAQATLLSHTPTTVCAKRKIRAHPAFAQDPSQRNQADQSKGHAQTLPINIHSRSSIGRKLGLGPLASFVGRERIFSRACKSIALGFLCLLMERLQLSLDVFRVRDHDGWQGTWRRRHLAVLTLAL